MPQVIKINDFTNSDITENIHGKFEKVYFKKLIKLEDINKNGVIKLEYDINNKPYLEINAHNEKTLLTSNSITVDIAKVHNIILNEEALQDKINKLCLKIEHLESRIKDMEEIEKIVTYDIDEDPCPELYLIEFENPNVGMFGIFTLNDNVKYLYICYKIDKNVSYWKQIFKY